MEDGAKPDLKAGCPLDDLKDGRMIVGQADGEDVSKGGTYFARTVCGSKSFISHTSDFSSPTLTMIFRPSGLTAPELISPGMVTTDLGFLESPSAI